MAKKLLLLGSTGKMGLALKEVFSPDYHCIEKNSEDFDANDFEQVRSLIAANKPDIVINTVAYLGIDPSEKDPETAFRLNTLYPKFLAQTSNEFSFVLIHFSTDAVFNDQKKDFYIESDPPGPLNLYGLTKYGGDCFVQALAKKYYLIRTSVLFGQVLKNRQFVEKMLDKIRQGCQTLNISDDIILSPTYSIDVAREIKRVLEARLASRLYHIANEGKASLYDLMKEIIDNLNLKVRVEKASYRDFPSVGIKNTFTPIKSQYLEPLRPWSDAVREYCLRVRNRL